MVTPTAIAQIGYQYYIVYAVISLIIPPSVYIFYAETRNRSLEEVDQIFRDSTSIAAAVRASGKMPVRNDFSGMLESKENGVGVEEVKCISHEYLMALSSNLCESRQDLEYMTGLIKGFHSEIYSI